MSARYRPDFDALRRESSAARARGTTKFRDAFMWPMINLEALSKPRTLLLFLNTRARNPPDIFWCADDRAWKVAQAVGAINEPLLNCYAMMFADRTSAETYGEIRPIRKDKRTADDIFVRCCGVPVGNELIVLEIQQRLMEFLVKCSTQILHDLSEEELVNHLIATEPVLRVDAPNAFPSLAAQRSDAPYLAPVGLDFARLRNNLEAKRAAAEDHIWALREDPAYFAYELRVMYNHRYEQVKDRYGRAHANLEPHRNHLIWAQVISSAVASADNYPETWTQLSELLEVVAELHTEHEIPADGTPPRKLREEASYLKSMLQRATQGPISDLAAYAFSSPPLQPSHERRVQDDEHSRRNGILPLALKDDSKLRDTTTVERQLHWLLKVITDEGSDTRYGLPLVLDELGRLLETEPEAKSLTSPFVARIISDLTFVTEALRQFDAFAGQFYESLLIPTTDSDGQPYTRPHQPYVNRLKIVEGSRPGEFHALAMPLNRFYYPVDKRRTRENHEAMQMAERNLDAFWRQVDANLEERRQWELDHLKTCTECCSCDGSDALRKLLISGSR